MPVSKGGGGGEGLGGLRFVSRRGAGLGLPLQVLHVSHHPAVAGVESLGRLQLLWRVLGGCEQLHRAVSHLHLMVYFLVQFMILEIQGQALAAIFYCQLTLSGSASVW